ncbi:Kinesin-2 [Hexamita inflata]|uniref:Kinesin-2 n=2 Tax=Hexamita inflata TaxID=28002 RepID=A0AA86NSS2_9EUKA|nr:Kinesin-2 [Hexamita inflata]CAI9965212.1 Kinesin-2 [Hexamita inflata]
MSTQAKISTVVRIRNQLEPELPFIFSEQEIESQRLTFAFDRVYGPASQSTDVFQSVVPLLEQFNAGFSATICAYGQSGSGKSFTMIESGGIVFQTVQYLFQSPKELQIQCVEIYNEQIRDLLDVTKTDLRLLETKTCVIENATNAVVTSHSEFNTVLSTSIKNRAVGCTNLNLQSSRSHLLIIITMNKQQLTLVDLAGSERVSKTQAQNNTLVQANSINSSLLVLGRVISALAHKEPFVPFRDSKLTRILRNSLGGSASSLVITCVSSLKEHLDESIQSMRFAIRCGMVVNVLKRQITKSEKEDENVTVLKEENNSLKDANTQMKEELALKDAEIRDLRDINEAQDEKYQKLKHTYMQLTKEILHKNKERDAELKQAYQLIAAQQTRYDEEMKSISKNLLKLTQSGFATELEQDSDE